jgi:hypothetical protein
MFISELKFWSCALLKKIRHICERPLNSHHTYSEREEIQTSHSIISNNEPEITSSNRRPWIKCFFVVVRQWFSTFSNSRHPYMTENNFEALLP